MKRINSQSIFNITILIVVCVLYILCGYFLLFSKKWKAPAWVDVYGGYPANMMHGYDSIYVDISVDPPDTLERFQYEWKWVDPDNPDSRGIAYRDRYFLVDDIKRVYIKKQQTP